MKKIHSAIVAVYVSVSLAGSVFAAELARKDAGPAPAAPATGEAKKEEIRLATKKSKKMKKAKKAEKKPDEKKEAAPATSEKK